MDLRYFLTQNLDFSRLRFGQNLGRSETQTPLVTSGGLVRRGHNSARKREKIKKPDLVGQCLACSEAEDPTRAAANKYFEWKHDPKNLESAVLTTVG